MPRTASPNAKPAVANGQAKLLQSENNLLLLRYLADHGSVPSRKAWAEGALAWIQAAGGHNYFGNLMTATHSVHGRFVSQIKVGSSHQFSITAEGLQALDLSLPVWIRGQGRFTGIGVNLDVRTAKKEEVEAVRRVCDLLLRRMEDEEKD
jgi:hypothetical protein